MKLCYSSITAWYSIFSEGYLLLPPFAVTDGQMLELMHDIMVGPRRPDKLIAKLQESHLLILGVNFTDWLASLFSGFPVLNHYGIHVH